MLRKKKTNVDGDILGSDMDELDVDDATTVLGGGGERKYVIEKEEYPPELLRTFDIV